MYNGGFLLFKKKKRMKFLATETFFSTIKASGIKTLQKSFEIRLKDSFIFFEIKNSVSNEEKSKDSTKLHKKNRILIKLLFQGQIK